jgi:hypothetical protein
MRNLVVVAFVEPVSEGMEFARAAWPLHITLVRFDVDAGAAVDDVDGGAGPSVAEPQNDELAARATSLMEAPVRAALGTMVAAGEPAAFGRNGSIPVTLIEPNPALQRLHEELVDVVEELRGRVATPAYTRAGYRPHVSHQGEKALRTGDRLGLDRIALVDMAPGGSHATRRILTLWNATL